MRDLRQRVGIEVAKAVVGLGNGIDAMLIALAVGGHILLEGPPGTAKTLVARAVAKSLGLDFKRIQFTPDMLPSDITGTMALSGGELRFCRGPIFAGAVLADEINRTPPKTQAALLEAMQEGSVSVDGTTYELPVPFIMVATQNPIEYEGTYPLPEAQLDRFLLKVDVGYPSEADEVALIDMGRHGLVDSALDQIVPVTTAEELLELRTLVDTTRVEVDVANYAARIVRHTRSLPSVELGASPRATVHLVAAARAKARLEGRDFVTPDDVRTMTNDVLRHRLLLTAEAALDRTRPEAVIGIALAGVEVPR